MTARVTRLALALLAPLLLVGCLLAPGKFTSTLTINADRTFTYSYQGEVYAFDLNEAMKDMPSGNDGDGDDTKKTGLQTAAFDGAAGQDSGPDAPQDKGTAKDDAKSKADTDAKNRELAATLSKEAGFRKVDYVGDNKFLIDYQISGRLDHTYLFPYNLDAGIIIPFVAVELRANGTVRVKAPGFANDSKDAAGGMGSDASKASAKLDGTFTLDTDAEIVSQNNEDGVKTVTGRKTVTWKATPLSSTAPMAVVRFAPGK
jgi:hypothetical protein